MPKTKILHITNGCTIGGAENHLMILLAELVKTKKYEITLAFFQERPDEAKSMVKDFNKAGVRTIDLNCKGKFPLRAFFKLFFIIRKGNYNLVHTHLFRSEFFGALAARLNGVKVISSIHNMEYFYANPFFGLLAKLNSGLISGYISISKAVNDYFTKNTRIAKKKITTVLYGYKKAVQKPLKKLSIRQEFKIAPQAPVLLTIARLAPQKGYEYLIEAMLKVKKSFPAVQLLIVGHDEKHLKQKLLKQIKSNGLTENIKIVGFRADTNKFLQACDLFVLPSLWEGFGLVLLEAMANKKAIVATKIGPIPEIVQNNKTGLLVPPAEADGLSKAVLKLLKDPKKRNSFAVKGHERLQKVFTIKKMVEKTIQLYQKTI